MALARDRSRDRSVSLERRSDLAIFPDPCDDPDMRTPGLQGVIDMVLAALYMLGFHDKVWEAERNILGYDPDGDDGGPQTLQTLAAEDDMWQRLLDDPDHLFNPQDMIDGSYRQFLADVLRLMEKNDCNFRRAVAIAETSPDKEQAARWSSWSCCAQKRVHVSLEGPPTRQPGIMPPASVMMRDASGTTLPLFGGGSPELKARDPK